MIIQIASNALVVLCGPSACGKTTWALKNFKPSQIITSDKCREMICDDETNQSISHLAFELMYHLIDLRLFLGNLTIADSTAITHEMRKRFLDIARPRGSPAVLIIFNIQLDVCLERNELRERRVERGVIERQYEEFKKALDSAHNEEFNKVYILGVNEMDQTTVELIQA